MKLVFSLMILSIMVPVNPHVGLLYFRAVTMIQAVFKNILMGTNGTQN